MEFEIQSGVRAGKSERHWQYVLNAAREHLLTTGDRCVVLAVGFFPGKPEMHATITFEVVKLDSQPYALASDADNCPTNCAEALIEDGRCTCRCHAKKP